MTAYRRWSFIRGLFALSMLLVCCGIGAQGPTMKRESKGTAIFFVWLADRLVVATDSMGINRDDPANPIDYNDCKIVVQGKANNFITVSGGVRRVDIPYENHGRKNTVNWDTQKLATQAYNSVKDARDPEKVANAWRGMALQQLNSLPIKLRLEAGEIGKNKMLFAGIKADGRIDVWLAELHFDGKQFSINLKRPRINFATSMAQGESLASEFMKQQTDRSKRENARWRTSLDSGFHVRSQPEFQTELVIEIVKFVIMYPPIEDGRPQVGGVVEAVKLQNSGITWLRPCPASAQRPKRR